jgi:glycosyltransferase involved in cell wall biosynthesis
VRIGFDAKRLFNNFTGLGNYSRFIVSSLQEFYPGDDYYLFTPKQKRNADTELFFDQSKFTTVVPPEWMAKLKLGSYWRSFRTASEAEKAHVQLFHGLSHELPGSLPSSIKSVVTVHDLIFIRYPQFYSAIDGAIYKAKVRHACRVADRIVAISQQTAEDVIDYLKVPREKIDVVYQGSHPNFKRKFSIEEIARIRSSYSLPSEYILNVGTIEERKNAAQLVKALSMLPESSRIPIVIVGKKTPYLEYIRDVAKKAGVEKYLVVLHDVRFADLPGIYQAAKVFVYPSLFEGFGIPLIEAIESDIPVITSRDSCFSEAAGPASTYIDPAQPEELAFQLEKVLTDAKLANEMVRGSKTYIERFQPEAIAKAMHDVYDRVVAG